MKYIFPDYYKEFQCSKGLCRHNCCIGWEIDIDDDTAEYYKTIPGKFGQRLMQNIDFGEECACFILGEKERCPFLNEKGLCDIIINLGEKALSQVCDDHPRFRNFYESRTEIGLGLCCEAAAKLVLEKETKTKIIEIGDDGEEFDFPAEEAEFFETRQKVFDILQKREIPMEERIEEALSLCGAKLPEKSFKDWAKIYLELERLDEKWTEVLLKIAEDDTALEIKNPLAAEQLLCYYFFRHFAPERPETAAFSVLCYYMTEMAAKFTGMEEATRLYSSEIEYSDENEEKLLDVIKNEV